MPPEVDALSKADNLLEIVNQLILCIAQEIYECEELVVERSTGILTHRFYEKTTLGETRFFCYNVSSMFGKKLELSECATGTIEYCYGRLSSVIHDYSFPYAVSTARNWFYSVLLRNLAVISLASGTKCRENRVRSALVVATAATAHPAVTVLICLDRVGNKNTTRQFKNVIAYATKDTSGRWVVRQKLHQILPYARRLQNSPSRHLIKKARKVSRTCGQITATPYAILDKNKIVTVARMLREFGNQELVSQFRKHLSPKGLPDDERENKTTVTGVEMAKNAPHECKTVSTGSSNKLTNG